jgi:hypothetical protein
VVASRNNTILNIYVLRARRGQKNYLTKQKKRAKKRVFPREKKYKKVKKSPKK